MIIPSSEENSPSLVPNEALRDSGLAEVLRDRSALLQDRVGGEDLGDEGVATGLRLEELDLGEDGLPETWLGIALLGLLRRCRFVRDRRHGF